MAVVNESQSQLDEHLEDLKRIQRLRLIDDDFMKSCFRDQIPAVEYVIAIILGRQLTVTELHVEDVLPNLHGRGVRFDIHAIDASGRHYNIEIQRSDKGAGAKRARYNSALLDASILKANEDHADLPETYVIFITENDVLKGGLPLYHIDRTIKELNHRNFVDGAHIVYVNSQYRGKDALGQLMADFNQSDPDKMSDSPLKTIVNYMKNTEEGVSKMCKELENMRDNAEARGRAEGFAAGESHGEKKTLEKSVTRMIRKHQTIDYIADMLGLSVDNVRRIAKESGLAY